MKFKVGSKVQWKWLGRPVQGIVQEVFTESVTKTIKGKKIKRNGTKENPAYLVESEAGNLALKLESEVSPRSKRRKSAWENPSLFKKSMHKSKIVAAEHVY